MNFLFYSINDDLSIFLLGECFDADDDNGRICGSITPDTVLYTLFRGKKKKKMKIKQDVTCPS